MTSTKKRENPWISLVFTIVLPSLILTKLSAADRLGTETAFALALALPLLYGAYDFWSRRTFNWIAAIGFIGIFMKGGLGFLKLNRFWFAVNEAAIPTLIGLVLWGSILLKKPLVGVFLLNDSIFRVDTINQLIDERQVRPQFESSLTQATYLLILSFAVSAVLNFVLAIWFLQSPVGTEAFNQELGVMTAVSTPVIVICSVSIMFFGLWRLIQTITKLTGMSLDDMMHQPPAKKDVSKA